MANSRGIPLTKDILLCPHCNYDYSKTNLIYRFLKSGNKANLSFYCDCGKDLLLSNCVNFFKIYDITERKIRRNIQIKAKRAKERENAARHAQ